MHANKLTTNPINIFKNKDNKKKNIFDKQGNLVWDYQNSLSIINKTIFNRFDILTTKRAYYDMSSFAPATIYKKEKGNIPVKTSNYLKSTEKYGGFSGYNFGSFCLLKLKSKTLIEAIPVSYKNNIDYYLHNECGYNDYEILIPNLKKYTLIKNGNSEFLLRGRYDKNNLDIANKNERIFSKDAIKTYKKIEKLLDRIRKNNLMDKINKNYHIKDYFDYSDDYLVISVAANKDTKEIKLTNSELIKLYDTYQSIFSKKVYSFEITSITKKINNFLECNKNKFLQLNIIFKAILLSNINNIFKVNKETIDLSLIGLSKTSFKFNISKNLKNCSIIYESITGFYRKVAYKID